MKRIVLLVSIFLLVITGCSKSDALRFKTEYEKYNGKKSSIGEEYITLNIDKKNVIKYSDINEIIDIIKNGTGVIYFGYPECMKCRNAVDVLLSTVKDTDIDVVYYLDVKDVRDRYSIDEEGNIVTEVASTEEYKELLNALDDILDEYTIKDNNGNDVDIGEKRLYVPLVLFVKDGVIEDSHYNTVYTQIDNKLSKDEKEELSSIYQKGIDSILNSNYCSKESEC